MRAGRCPPGQEPARAAKRGTSDSQWLAQNFERGAVRSCFVAAPEFLTSEQEGEALASITTAAAGRTDLLAHAARILLGFHEGTPGEASARHTADLMIKAGADQHQIPRWTEEGRRRAHPGIPEHRP